jgi:hypothetical protein
MDLERGPLTLVSKIEELLERRNNDFGLENRDYGRKGFAALITRHPSILKKFALTLQTSSGHSVGRVLSWTQAMEFFLVFCT